MAEFTATALRLIQLYGPLAVATFTFLESSMLFPFLPSEIIVPAAAALLVHDSSSFIVFVGAAGIGGTVGALVLFSAFYGPGSRMIDRLRDVIQFSDETLERSRQWFLRWGAFSVLWGRFLPGLRSIISIPAGLFRMNPVWFGIFTAIGTIGFYTIIAALVYFVQEQSLLRGIRILAADRPILVALIFGGILGLTLPITFLYRHMTGG